MPQQEIDVAAVGEWQDAMTGRPIGVIWTDFVNGSFGILNPINKYLSIVFNGGFAMVALGARNEVPRGRAFGLRTKFFQPGWKTVAGLCFGLRSSFDRAKWSYSALTLEVIPPSRPGFPFQLAVTRYDSHKSVRVLGSVALVRTPNGPVPVELGWDSGGATRIEFDGANQSELVTQVRAAIAEAAESSHGLFGAYVTLGCAIYSQYEFRIEV